MQLNTLKPADGAKAKKTRVGRGIGSGLGKTCGRGHKGQKARSGGYHKRGFEGGQMPIHMRLPKFGFTSQKSLSRTEILLSQLSKIGENVVDLLTLKQANLIGANVKTVKIIATGTIDKAVTIGSGIGVSKGARAAIEAAGGKVEE